MNALVEVAALEVGRGAGDRRAALHQEHTNRESIQSIYHRITKSRLCLMYY